MGTMNGANFRKTTQYRLQGIDDFLHLIVYSYHLLLRDKKTYSRAGILQTIKDVTNSTNPHNEIEDYLCDDLIDKYIRPNKHLFRLQYYAVDAGVKESK